MSRFDNPFGKPPRDAEERKKLREYAERRAYDPEAAQQLPAAGAPNEIVPKQLVRPNAREAALFANKRQKVCGGCRFANHAAAQQKMKDQRFMDVLLRELKWKKHHLCNEPEHMMLCEQDGQMLVGPDSLACDQYRPK